MYRSFAAFCGADVARNYSARFLQAAPAGAQIAILGSNAQGSETRKNLADWHIS